MESGLSKWPRYMRVQKVYSSLFISDHLFCPVIPPPPLLAIIRKFENQERGLERLRYLDIVMCKYFRALVASNCKFQAGICVPLPWYIRLNSLILYTLPSPKFEHNLPPHQKYLPCQELRSLKTGVTLISVAICSWSLLDEISFSGFRQQ